MFPRPSSLTAALLVPLLAACAGGAPQAYHSAASEARLTKSLAGKVAGPALSCMPFHRTGDLEVIDSDTILFRDGRTVYRQETMGDCYPGGGKSNYALVTQSYSGRLCSGDIARTVDLTSGVTGGSCSFTQFVPYRQR